MLKSSLYIGAAVMAAFLIKVASVQLTADKPAEDNIQEVKISPKKKTKRKPASVSVQQTTFNREVARPYDPVKNLGTSFNPPPAEETMAMEDEAEKTASSEGPTSVGEYSADATSTDSGSSSNRTNRTGSRVGSLSNSSARPSTTAPSTSSSPRAPAAGPLGPTMSCIGCPSTLAKPVTTTTGGAGSGDSDTGGSGSGSSSGSSSGSGSGNLSTLTCATDVGAGAYNNPISVAINCTTTATIKYCVSNTACSVSTCDPTAGAVYSSPVVIGATQGSFCLSFTGTSTAGIVSTEVDANYIINNTLPHLDVTHVQTWYQTTELTGVSAIASNDFGLPGFGAGQINMKHNDPGASGLNLACDEIATNYVTYPAPAPLSILDLFDTSGIANTDQIDVPLVLADLEYGDNFITSYMKNSNYAAPLYSCSTTKVRLEDFDYFQADSSHGEDGTNTVREFAGGFTAYGFFEPELADPMLPRSPAGVSAEETSGERLESGIFSIFY